MAGDEKSGYRGDEGDACGDGASWNGLTASLPAGFTGDSRFDGGFPGI